METTEDQIQKALEVLRKAGLFSPLNGAINDVPVVGQFDSDGKMVATEITEERLEKAKQLLRDPRLIDRYKDLCGAAYVGREEELVLLRLALTSRLFPWALWVIVFGPSGVGKNALLKAALGTVWPEDAEAFTRISPQYLLYRDRPLDHRIITIYEWQAQARPCTFCGRCARRGGCDSERSEAVAWKSINRRRGRLCCRRRRQIS